jgi:hypothetical protein
MHYKIEEQDMTTEEALSDAEDVWSRSVSFSKRYKKKRPMGKVMEAFRAEIEKQNMDTASFRY